MTRFVRFSCLALYLMTAVLVLSACQTYSANGSSTTGTDESASTPTVNYIRLAPMAPPLPKAETRPMLDDPRTQYWRAGYWSYDNGTFDWVPGEVIARPSPTAVWSPAYWIRHNYGWALVAGYWQ